MRLRVVDDEGELLITLGQLYALLRRRARFEGPYVEVESEIEEEEVPDFVCCAACWEQCCNMGYVMEQPIY